MRPLALTRCERCRAFPATQLRQDLQLTTGPTGKPIGRAVPVAVCDDCAGEWPAVAGDRTGGGR